MCAAALSGVGSVALDPVAVSWVLRPAIFFSASEHREAQKLEMLQYFQSWKWSFKGMSRVAGILNHKMPTSRLKHSAHSARRSKTAENKTKQCPQLRLPAKFYHKAGEHAEVDVVEGTGHCYKKPTKRAGQEKANKSEGRGLMI